LGYNGYAEVCNDDIIGELRPTIGEKMGELRPAMGKNGKAMTCDGEKMGELRPAMGK